MTIKIITFFQKLLVLSIHSSIQYPYLSSLIYIFIPFYSSLQEIGVSRQF